MIGISDKSFGLLIAFVVPGFVALHGIASHSPSVAVWFEGPLASPTFSGYLFAATASLSIGLVASAVRWLTIDKLCHLSGINVPNWDFSALAEKLEAFDALVISHYRYYQFYANLAVVLPAWASLVVSAGELSLRQSSVLLIVEIVLLAAARDTLEKYYRRTEVLLHKKNGSVILVGT